MVEERAFRPALKASNGKGLLALVAPQLLPVLTLNVKPL